MGEAEWVKAVRISSVATLTISRNTRWEIGVDQYSQSSLATGLNQYFGARCVAEEGLRACARTVSTGLKNHD